MSKDPFFHIPENAEWNACIGDQSDPLFYAKGYIEAGLALSEFILRDELHGERDTLIMPILYNARHSVELYLKLAIDEFSRVRIVTARPPLNHNIASQFAFLRNVEQRDLKLRIILDDLDPFIHSLNKVDKNGEAFRYFSDKDGEQTIGDHSLANIEVINVSLKKLKEILEEFFWRSFDLCEEYLTETVTDRLSRVDLFEIAHRLPARSDWSGPEFESTKSKLKTQFNLTNRKFSEALDKIQQTRELKGIIGIETPMVHLGDTKAIFVSQQWRNMHPKKEQNENEPFIVNAADFVFDDEEFERDRNILRILKDQLTIEEIADARTIYYLGLNNEYSEYYEKYLQEDKKRYAAGTDPRQDLNDLMAKTNFLVEFRKGLGKVGQVELAKELATV